MKKVLICGESHFAYTVHIQGADTMESTQYYEQVEWLKVAIEKAGYHVDYLPNHRVANEMPDTVERLRKYNLIILSDVGANTLMTPDTSYKYGKIAPYRCEAIKKYVESGGALILVGGFMSYTGIDGKARYGMTPIADILPVDLLTYDDRVEISSGIAPTITNPNHPVFNYIPKDWNPYFLGYNKTISNPEKGEVIARFNHDPFIAVGEFGKGRVVAYTTDCAPHWAPKLFLESPEYQILWKNIVDWSTADN